MEAMTIVTCIAVAEEISENHLVLIWFPLMFIWPLTKYSYYTLLHSVSVQYYHQSEWLELELVNYVRNDTFKDVGNLRWLMFHLATK